MIDLKSQRQRIRHLLDIEAPEDAQGVYYALHHVPRRTDLTIHADNEGVVDGFVVVCQTGQRLFRPTVVLRASTDCAAHVLLRQALIAGRSYYITTTLELREAVLEVVHIEQPEMLAIYRLDPSRFHPDINVMVVEESSPGGVLRFIIRSRGDIVAEAGINWASPFFADLSTRTVPAARQRGWGKAVLSASSAWVVRSARTPLCTVSEANKASIALARSVGYVDTGRREFAGEGGRRP